MILLTSLTAAFAERMKAGADIHEVYAFGKDVMAFLFAHGLIIRRHKSKH